MHCLLLLQISLGYVNHFQELIKIVSNAAYIDLTYNSSKLALAVNLYQKDLSYIHLHSFFTLGYVIAQV